MEELRRTFRLAVRSMGGSAEAAKVLDCTRAYVDMLCQGKRRPGMKVAYAIERHIGITMQAWMEGA